jgi:predicted DNA-binding transcriptional regulator AlpA
MRAADAKKLPDGTDRIINKKQTASLIGVSVSTLDRMIRRNGFPQPLQLSTRRVGWPLSLILAWISARPIRSPSTPHHHRALVDR